MNYTSKYTGAEIDAAIAKVQDIPDNIVEGASDAELRNRSTHTGTQNVSTITGLAAVATSGAYGDILNLPTAFPPSTHSHSLSDISGTGTAAAANTGDFAPASHSHSLSDISGTGTAAAAATGDFATAAQGGKADSALQDVAEDTTPQLGGELDAQGFAIGGFLGKVVTGVSGVLNAAAHSGNLLKTTGNVTVPTVAGFACQIEAGGGHTVTFNGTTTAAMAAGDVMSILVTSSTTVRAALIKMADQVEFT